MRVEAAGGDGLVRIGRELRIGLELTGLLEPLLRLLGCEVEQQRRNAGVGAVQRDLRTHGAGAEHRDGVDGDHRRPTPLMNRSTTASASAVSAYLRRLSIQLVAISSSAPKKILVAVVALMSLRNAPLCC